MSRKTQDVIFAIMVALGFLLATWAFLNSPATSADEQNLNHCHCSCQKSHDYPVWLGW